MHPICSWMVTVDLFDELILSRLESGTLSRYAIIWHKDALRRSEIDWSVSSDLAVRAHLALQRELGRDLPIQLRLEKRIPVGGGLGGGSSDAAAMLRAVNELYELGLSPDDLADIGNSLGSDVPFLVHGGSAIVQGLGDEIERHESAPDFHAVLAFPEFLCETPRVYGLFDELNADHVHALRREEVMSLAGNGSTNPQPDALFNDLAAAATRSAPRLEGLIERLSDLAECPVHVSGSGSSLFVICDDPLHAEALAKATHSKLQLAAVAVKSCMNHEMKNVESSS